ncbi:hypothetical protein PB01_10025 [Psychrobacillus glaciei]|uniref:DUF3221 domain-containing protein n=1 Tax=Psychrobacillus glaciei TaxID=2283160 RepID=A0A5J6SUH3_9BACI|nr:hypothetical protein PB01_10025 [Psychrobacillus glaciei]
MLKQWNNQVRIVRVLFFVSLVSLIVSGCSNGMTTGNPTPKDMLKNGDADIFLLEDIVYANAQDIEWVQDTYYTLGNQVGEITKQKVSAFNFNNGTASKLPVGTKIYATGKGFYVAVVDGTEIPYIKLLEG